MTDKEKVDKELADSVSIAIKSRIDGLNKVGHNLACLSTVVTGTGTMVQLCGNLKTLGALKAAFLMLNQVIEELRQKDPQGFAEAMEELQATNIGSMHIVTDMDSLKEALEDEAVGRSFPDANCKTVGNA